jgi:hypothetical protein
VEETTLNQVESSISRQICLPAIFFAKYSSRHFRFQFKMARTGIDDKKQAKQQERRLSATTQERQKAPAPAYHTH